MSRDGNATAADSQIVHFATRNFGMLGGAALGSSLGGHRNHAKPQQCLGYYDLMRGIDYSNDSASVGAPFANLPVGTVRIFLPEQEQRMQRLILQLVETFVHRSDRAFIMSNAINDCGTNVR